VNTTSVVIIIGTATRTALLVLRITGTAPAVGSLRVTAVGARTIAAIQLKFRAVLTDNRSPMGRFTHASFESMRAVRALRFVDPIRPSRGSTLGAVPPGPTCKTLLKAKPMERNVKSTRGPGTSPIRTSRAQPAGDVRRPLTDRPVHASNQIACRHCCELLQSNR